MAEERPGSMTVAESTPVPSPCVRVCRPEVPGGPCVGCMRTTDEIRGWFRMSEDQRREVVDDIPRRMKERLAALRQAAAGNAAARQPPGT